MPLVLVFLVLWMNDSSYMQINNYNDNKEYVYVQRAAL